MHYYLHGSVQCDALLVYNYIIQLALESNSLENGIIGSGDQYSEHGAYKIASSPGPISLKKKTREGLISNVTCPAALSRDISSAWVRCAQQVTSTHARSLSNCCVLAAIGERCKTD